MIAMAKQPRRARVIGGPDPPHHAAAYLDAGADVVVIGEGEQTLEELLAGASGHAMLDRRSAIHGIVFKAADGTIVRTPPRALLPDLDAPAVSRSRRHRSAVRTCTPGASVTASARCR